MIQFQQCAFYVITPGFPCFLLHIESQKMFLHDLFVQVRHFLLFFFAPPKNQKHARCVEVSWTAQCSLINIKWTISSSYIKSTKTKTKKGAKEKEKKKQKKPHLQKYGSYSFCPCLFHCSSCFCYFSSSWHLLSCV